MVPPTSPTDISLEEEREVRAEALYGLKLAADETLGDDRRDLTKTEREKFLYFSIRDLDLPLTYSWYLAGAKTYADSTPQTPASTPQSSARQTYGGIQEDTTEVSSDVQKYRDYFQDTTFFSDYDLTKIIYTRQAEFLCDFYKACADEKYADLYVHSTRLREELKRLDEHLNHDSTNRSLTDWGGGTDDGLLSRNKEEEIRRIVSHLHMDIAQLDGFEETRGPVKRGTDVIENVLAKLTHLSSIDEEQKALVNELDDFFFGTVWKYPALKISTETATGPNEREHKEKRQSRLDQYEDILHRWAGKHAEKHRDAGLEPTIEEYNANEDDDSMQYLHEMTRDVLDHEQ